MDSRNVIYENFKKKHLHSFLPPPWDQGEMIFVSSARQGGNC